MTVGGNNGISILRNNLPKAILPLLGLGKQNLMVFPLDFQREVNLHENEEIWVLNNQIRKKRDQWAGVKIQAHQLHFGFYFTEVSRKTYCPHLKRIKKNGVNYFSCVCENLLGTIV